MASIASDKVINTIFAKKQKTFVLIIEKECLGFFFAKTGPINFATGKRGRGSSTLMLLYRKKKHKKDFGLLLAIYMLLIPPL
jgi:hypothetical protein